MKSVNRPTLRPSFGPSLLHTLVERTKLPSPAARPPERACCPPAPPTDPQQRATTPPAPVAKPAKRSAKLKRTTRPPAPAAKVLPPEIAPDSGARAPLQPRGNTPTAGSETKRVRAAGGPEDLASYSCSCGLLFTAPVSTSVTCPHCGAGQAW